jgi:hypothetical protein
MKRSFWVLPTLFDTQENTPSRDYEWAVDALLEALAHMNKGEPEKAHLSIRTALWHPDHHPKLSP